MNVFPERMSVHHACAQCLRRSEEGLDLPEMVTDGWVLGNKLVFPKREQVLLTAEPTLQP